MTRRLLLCIFSLLSVPALHAESASTAPAVEDLRIQQYGDTAVLAFRPAGSVQDGTHDFYAIRDGKPGKLACILSYNHELTQ